MVESGTGDCFENPRLRFSNTGSGLGPGSYRGGYLPRLPLPEGYIRLAGASPNGYAGLKGAGIRLQTMAVVAVQIILAR